jgi:predicted nucleic acid-binding protein
MSFFDTDFVVDLLREQRRGIEGRAHRKLQQLGDSPVRLSIFVVCELEAGAALSQGPEERQRVHSLCEQFEVVYPDERFAPIYGETLAELKRQNYTVATMDLLIGTQALVEDDTLITRNLRHFQKIPNLRVEGY